MSNQLQQGLYEDKGQSTYGETARDYASLWRGHTPDPSHYTKVRGKFLRWMNEAAQEGVLPNSGALLICGPGYNFTERDATPEMVDGTFNAHPLIIGADWSIDTLQDFGSGIEAASKQAFKKTVLTQRDFTSGLATKFHILITEKLREVRDIDGLRNFISWVKNEIGINEVLNITIETTRPARGSNRVSNTILDIQDPFDFDSFVEEVSTKVRFITANMLLAGTLALTEKDVREVMILHKEAMKPDELVQMLADWHALIRVLNTHIASIFIVSALKKNPDARIFAPTDTNSQYDGLDTFERLNLAELRKNISHHGFKFVEGSQWTEDDSGEIPPHTHQMRLLLACSGEPARNRQMTFEGDSDDQLTFPTASSTLAPTDGLDAVCT